MDGIIVINKEKGFTSFDVVAKMRGILKTKKIGHAGTLDPDATGVLPILVGKATKLSDMMSDSGKAYRVTFKLGVSTDTEDLTGKILEEREVFVTEDDVLTVIKSFVGPYDQIPPMYSALKVNGKTLYELAREGITVERKARRITIYSIEDIDINFPFVSMTVSCSKGTYIRSLCRDIGDKLGTLASMKELVRVKAAGFSLDESYTLKEVEELVNNGEINSILHPLFEFFGDLKSYQVNSESEKYALNGNKLNKDNFKEIPVESEILVFLNNGHFVGIYRLDKDDIYKPYKLFFV